MLTDIMDTMKSEKAIRAKVSSLKGIIQEASHEFMIQETRTKELQPLLSMNKDKEKLMKPLTEEFLECREIMDRIPQIVAIASWKMEMLEWVLEEETEKKEKKVNIIATMY
jgi:HKD family nuclease